VIHFPHETEPKILDRARSLLSAVSLLLHGHGTLSYFLGLATKSFGTTNYTEFDLDHSE